MTKLAAHLLTQLSVRVAAKALDKPLSATLETTQKAADAVAGTYRTATNTIRKVKRTFCGTEADHPQPTRREPSIYDKIEGAQALADHYRAQAEDHDVEAKRLVQEGTQWFLLPVVLTAILLLTRLSIILTLGGLCISLLMSVLVFSRARAEASDERLKSEQNRAMMKDRLDHIVKLREALK